MKRLLRLLQWLLKAAVFFTLFAFALNNQQETRVNFFFSTYWSAPTVLGMVPRWWRERQAVKQNQSAPAQAQPAPEVSRGI